ncbi:DUF4276 family protein [bacterium]|nr:DUF4276 family protein [bacterium]
MSNFINIVVIVEGKTEEIFIKDILAPYLAKNNIFMTPIIISKPGQKGGDVRFSRAFNDIEKHLKQRSNTYISLFVDYYGIKGDWPGIDSAKSKTIPTEIAKIINDATQKAVDSKLCDYDSERRFIPNIIVHEFEALLFSDSGELARQLNVNKKDILIILEECGEPEKINDSSKTAPSKRLNHLYKRYKKTSTGIVIARAIGVERMREQCVVFDNWLQVIEEKMNRNKLL